MAATSNRRSAGDIITALITAVTNVSVTINGAPAPAFQRVEYFDSEKLAEAFQYLLITEQRVCVIIPLEEQFETVLQQPRLLVKRTLPVMLIMSDRLLGTANRRAALLGNNTTLGAHGQLEAVLPAVTGQLLANPGGVLVIPRNACALTLSDKDQAKLAGRVGVMLQLDCIGGTLTADLGRSPIL